MEGPEATTGMIEDAIEDDPHAAVVRLIQELSQGGIAPEQGVDLVVIIGVVAVVGGRGKNGGQVQRGHTECPQVSSLSMIPSKSPP